MSNSSLVNFIRISPNSSNPRNKTIKKITIHHVAGNLSVEQIGEIFANPAREASSNYGIDSDGRVGLYVDEQNRSWCSGNADNDNQAITIEVANNSGAPDWTISVKAMVKLLNLCVDICKRNGIKELVYTGDATGNLTLHKMFQATACPGPYLESKMPDIAKQVNEALASDSNTYTVKAGDSLWAIAAKLLGNGARYTEIKALNGMKSNFIAPGQTLKIPTSAPNEIVVGSVVRLKEGAKTYTGSPLASFVYKRNHVVKSINGNRVVITYNGVVIAAVKKPDLILI